MILENIDLSSPIHKLHFSDGENEYFMKREDLLPFSFGGNKVRIALKYFNDMMSKGCDCMVAYGNSRSNLCRVIANISAAYKIPCYIISPSDAEGGRVETNNSMMVSMFGAHVIPCAKSEVAITVEKILQSCEAKGYQPYYTNGNKFGEGNERTPVQAYVDVYNEICEYETSTGVMFDYIFHASGTGMTQAGLISGSLLHHQNRKIVGISVARPHDVGCTAILKYVQSYFGNNDIVDVDFEDEYCAGGYGVADEEIRQTIFDVLCSDGIPLDQTYTGKAFCGMRKYVQKQAISGKKLLFIHTGGVPLFFDSLTHQKTPGDNNS